MTAAVETVCMNVMSAGTASASERETRSVLGPGASVTGEHQWFVGCVPLEKSSLHVMPHIRTRC